MGPLLTLKVHEVLRAAARNGTRTVECSLDLERSRSSVEVGADDWTWQGTRYPFLDACKDRTIYYWSGAEFQPAARYTNSLIKLVPTEWGPPTFEIDGIKMLPTAQVSPYADAERKVGFIRPRGKVILDTCGGLGYFASWCLQGQAARVQSYEKNADVIWLRGLNPWSPLASQSPTAGGGLPLAVRELPPAGGGSPLAVRESLPAGGGLTLVQADVAVAIAGLPEQSFDAVLHDPPRFGIAGELYSQVFYDHLARVLRPRGLLFHYTGTPNKLTSGRDVPNEVANRLRTAGFTTELKGDGILAVRGRAAGRTTPDQGR
jgi:predicted methyltransferase